jgi:hypothetical protein
LQKIRTSFYDKNEIVVKNGNEAGNEYVDPSAGFSLNKDISESLKSTFNNRAPIYLKEQRISTLADQFPWIRVLQYVKLYYF